MAIRQKYRENSQQKQYEMIVDFSKGINTKEADSLLTDNVARNVENFNIIAGGMLSKRAGFENIGVKDANGISKQTKDVFEIMKSEFPSNYINTNHDIGKVEIIKTLNFNDGNKSIISSITKDGIVLNTIIDYDDTYSHTTHIKINEKNTDKAKIETDGINIFLFTQKTEIITETDGKTKEKISNTLYKWVSDNWIELKTQAQAQVSSNRSIDKNIELEVRDLNLTFLDSNRQPSGTKYSSRGDFIIFNNLDDSEYFKDKTTNTGFVSEDTDYVYNYSLDNTNIKVDFNFNVGLVAGEWSSHLDRKYVRFDHGGSNPSEVTATTTLDKDALNAATLPNGVTIQDLLKMIMTGSDRVKVETEIRNWIGVDPNSPQTNNFNYVSFDYVVSIVLDGSKILTNTKTINPDLSSLFRFDTPDAQFGTLWPYPISLRDKDSFAKDDVKPSNLKINLKSSYTKTLKIGSSVEDANIYIPNAFSMQFMSYNMLTLNSLDIPQSFDKVDAAKMNVDTDTASFPELDGVILLNGYYAVVNKNMNMKASLALRPTDTRSNWKFGYLFMPVEEWAILYRNAETEQDYISKIVKPAFSSGVNTNGEFTIMPKTSGEYILVIFATDADISNDAAWGTRKTEDFLSIRKNIIPKETIGEVQPPSDVVYNFFKADKSIVWKNQMFMYGGSNSFFISTPKNFTYFPMFYNRQIPTKAEIKSIAIYYDSLIIATEKTQYLLTGDNPDNFILQDLNQDIGVIANKTVKNNANYLFQLTEDGVYKVKSLYNFKDRYNVEKLDSQITGDVKLDGNASAVVFRNKYYLHTPSDNKIWIYYNDYNSWIKYTSTLFDLSDMFTINNELYLVSNVGGAIYKMKSFNSNLINDKGENEGYYDTDQTNQNSIITSIYKSKQIDFGLPNHDKAMKKLHVRFEETPGLSPVFINGWVDSSQVINDSVDTLVQGVGGVLGYVNTRVPQIKTIPQGDFQSSSRTTGANFSVQDNDTRFVSDTDQLHEIVISGRGRQFQFEVRHEKPIKTNIKNFGVILKTKKPKARRIRSTK